MPRSYAALHWPRQFRRVPDASYIPLLLSQLSDAFATSFQPLSTVSESPRSGNTLYSVTLGALRYSLKVARDTTSGTGWSLPPPVISKGPGVAFVFTLAGGFGKTLANAASNSGLPGGGMGYFA